MPVTAFYAAILALIFIALSWRVIGVRRSERISLGDGDSKLLLQRMRIHANFAEYTPITLILIGLLESMQADHRVLHVLGALFVLGRLSHVLGMSGKGDLRFRAGGMITTFVVMAVAALLCAYGAIWHGI